MAAQTSVRVGTGPVLLLTLLFVALRLCGVIGWSWWWVLSPLWITLALAGLVGVLWLLVFFWITRRKSC